MNERLAARAEQRIAKGLGPREKGFCQKWIRLLVEAEYGGRFSALWADPQGEGFLDAKRTARQCLLLSASGRLPRGVTVIRSRAVADTQVGDLLYKTSGTHGHVGIRVKGNRVAENSSTPVGRMSGALGYRTLEQYGPFDVIVRLPEPPRKDG